MNVYVPVIEQAPSNISQQTSSNATLTCIVSGATNITWVRIGVEGLPPQAYVTTNYSGMTIESYLHIPFIQPSDSGHYQCVATTANVTVTTTAEVIVQSMPSDRPTTPTDGAMTASVGIVIAFVSVVLGTVLAATCLSIIITVTCRKRFHKTNSPTQGIQLQSITHTTGPKIEDIDLPDNVFSGDAVRASKGSRRARKLGSVTSTDGLLDNHDTSPTHTKGDIHLPVIEEDMCPSSTGVENTLMSEEHGTAAVPHYTLIAPRESRSQPLDNPYAAIHTPTSATGSNQYAELGPVPYLTSSSLNMATSASQSSQPELDLIGPTAETLSRPWYENSNSSLRQVGIRDEIQPYATTSNLSIPLDPPPPVAKRSWSPPSTSPSHTSQVPVPYMDPLPIRQGLSNRRPPLSPPMIEGDFV